MGPRRVTDSGIEVEPLYEPTERDAERALGRPGSFPYTRGIHAGMHRDRLWTMRQYAGFGSAEATNERFRYLLSAGQTGLSVAFDLPTQMGYDSDHPAAAAEVGRVGVAIDSLADMEVLFDGIPLAEVSTSMTINATAAILLLLYELVAARQGAPPDSITGTTQNDILKEYTARGTYIYPPGPSMRIVTDLFAYCRERLPRWNTISISGYHMREAGSTAVQEVAFTLADGVAYVQAALDAGLAVDDFAPRLSFFFASHMNLFEEAAKFRAARRLWATIMRDRFGASDPRSMKLRFHTQTGGATLTAQQAENNIVRTALEALSAVLGGTQSLHTNSFDEALALPSQKAATIALRTQQILAFESGVADTPDPLGGSWYVEALTDEIEARARAYIERIDDMGGAIAAIESGWMKEEIEESAYRIARAVESGERVVVGVNRFGGAEEEDIELLELDPELGRRQARRLADVRAGRDEAAVEAALKSVGETARGSDNLLHPMREALAAYATLGEVSDALRAVFGEHRPT
ncbi:MAG TPA: methylmalonyl-CoA mutase family protein [Actinomycetota bacterium]|nr:methylmalonyl-CoA mutase family protein [Actinomycetota bacterium]